MQVVYGFTCSPKSLVGEMFENEDDLFMEWVHLHGSVFKLGCLWKRWTRSASCVPVRARFCNPKADLPKEQRHGNVVFELQVHACFEEENLEDHFGWCAENFPASKKLSHESNQTKCLYEGV